MGSKIPKSVYVRTDSTKVEPMTVDIPNIPEFPTVD
jgi:hypothetical protein